MAQSEIVVMLVGVFVGAFLGFLSTIGIDYYQENVKLFLCKRDKKLRKKYLGDLLADMKYNKELAEKEEKGGYHTLLYLTSFSFCRLKRENFGSLRVNRWGSVPIIG